MSLQRDELERAGCQTIYTDKVSGATTDRPELQQCLKALRPGDTLVVWRLDRLGRSLKDLVEIVTALENQGIGFESRTEKIETATPSGKLMFHVFSALAEFERNLIRERTNAGLQAARARGRVGGRRPKITEKDLDYARTLLEKPNASVSEVAALFGVTRQTLYRRLGAIQPKDDGDIIVEPTQSAKDPFEGFDDLWPDDANNTDKDQ